MGLKFVDQYSLLHFSIGVIFYFWNIKLDTSIIIHIIYELLENTKIGMRYINKFTYWPGGKPSADSLINSIGDTIFFIIGWIIANYFDILYKLKIINYKL